ncbi:invasion associated locus B family protein [Bradyrhizobium sp. 2TAF24]|uniref:invasion associated locus B family protein n=1 Tax=Bradyrhizobium sp. 2TAF24 TaxID=3233011 RepID=UPI003F91EDD2
MTLSIDRRPAATTRAALRLLLGLTLAGTFLSSAAQAASLPGGAGSLVESYQDWSLACQAQNNNVSCVIRQVQTNTQTNQTVLAMELHNAQGGKLEGALLLPFGLALAQGASLKLDETALGSPLAFSTCVPAGCLVPVAFDAATVGKLKTGTAINITAATLGNPQPTAFKVSLKGFGGALARLVDLLK